uniref:Phenoloxidase-activating factor 2 n=1 Tax=Nilaparvata lugens TaxID=108931 RepID=A0A068F794_NILLU|nr:stubble-5 [Nilaparvata lugens]
MTVGVVTSQKTGLPCVPNLSSDSMTLSRSLMILVIVGMMSSFCHMETIYDDTVVVNAIDNNDLPENDNAGAGIEPVTANNPRITDVLTNSQGHSCVCVPFYRCSVNNTLITDGAGIIDIRSKPESLCPHYMDVCCENNPTDGRNPAEDRVEPVSTTDPPLLNEHSTTNPPLVNEHSTTSNLPFVNEQKEGCGWRHTGGVRFRITGNVNNEAQFGEFPWMLALLVNNRIDENTTLKLFACGASLIHPQVVLTAAHCIKGRNTNDLMIRAGEWDTQTKNEILPHVDVNVGESIVHENYYAGGLHNDIALLVLQRPLQFSEYINTVCLPPRNTVPSIATCTATGWGKDEYGKEGKYQVIMKKIDLPIVPRHVCETKLRQTRLGQFFRLHDSFVCAGGELGRDTCKGDGGGPLVCPIAGTQERYYQTGIIAWGIECGTATPGVYVNTALFRNWIDQKMRLFNFDTSYYNYQ